MTKHAKLPSGATLPVDVPKEAVAKLRGLAERSGQTIELLVQEAIERYFEDLDDLRAAQDVLARRRHEDSRTYSIEELERELGLER